MTRLPPRRAGRTQRARPLRARALARGLLNRANAPSAPPQAAITALTMRAEAHDRIEALTAPLAFVLALLVAYHRPGVPRAEAVRARRAERLSAVGAGTLAVGVLVLAVAPLCKEQREGRRVSREEREERANIIKIKRMHARPHTWQRHTPPSQKRRWPPSAPIVGKGRLQLGHSHSPAAFCCGMPSAPCR